MSMFRDFIARKMEEALRTSIANLQRRREEAIKFANALEAEMATQFAVYDRVFERRNTEIKDRRSHQRADRGQARMRRNQPREGRRISDVTDYTELPVR